MLYCGENDIAAKENISAAAVLKRVQDLFTDIRKRLPNIPFVFISIKPSPSRWNLEPIIVEANRLIKQYLIKQKNTSFVNIHNAMLLKDGSVNAELFINDQLHMNAKGYAIWKKSLLPFLVR